MRKSLSPQNTGVQILQMRYRYTIIQFVCSWSNVWKEIVIMFEKNSYTNIFFSILYIKKESLSTSAIPKGGSDDLIIFKCFRAIFFLKKENYPISAFVQSLFSTKKSPKVVNFPLINERLCLSFWRHKQYKWLFQFPKLSWGSYVSL